MDTETLSCLCTSTKVVILFEYTNLLHVICYLLVLNDIKKR